MSDFASFLRFPNLILSGAAALSAHAMQSSPEPFAPEVFSRPGVMVAPGFAITGDGASIFYVDTCSDIMSSKREGSGWSNPVRTAFSQGYINGDPFVSPDGERLYFFSNRPLPGKTFHVRGTALWVARKTPGGWGEPQDLGDEVNGLRSCVFPVVTARGDLYFTALSKDVPRHNEIFCARRVADGFAAPEGLGELINTPANEYDAWVAPDGNLLVFSRTGKKAGTSALYVSRRSYDGDWTPPRDLGPKVNFGRNTTCPAVSPDGRILLFTSNGGGGREAGTYQISATVLDEVGTENVRDAEQFAPGLVSRSGAMCASLTPDGNEVFFSQNRQHVVISRLRDGKWSSPERVPLPEEAIKRSPAISPDGAELVFVSDFHSPAGESSLGFCRVRRVNGEWSGPERIGTLIPGRPGAIIGSPAIAADGSLYFTAPATAENPKSDIYCARRNGSDYEPAVNLGALVNSEANELGVAVAPDESFLVFASDRPGGLGSADLYISRRDADGNWLAPENLGPEVNSKRMEYLPVVVPDLGLVFFSDRTSSPMIYRAALK